VNDFVTRGLRSGIRAVTRSQPVLRRTSQLPQRQRGTAGRCTRGGLTKRTEGRGAMAPSTNRITSRFWLYVTPHG